MTTTSREFSAGIDDEIHNAGDFEPPAREVEDWEATAFEEEVGTSFTLSPSQFVEQAILMPDPHTRKLEPFDFSERPDLKKN